MDNNILDDRDDFEVEFDSQFEEEETEQTIDTDDITGDASSNALTDTDDVELDEDSEDEVGDLRIHSKTYHKTITTAEANSIKEEIAKKEKELDESREKMQEKKEDGDLSENEAYHYFRDKVSGLESDIARLTDELRSSIISDANANSSVIGKGSKVHLVITDSNNLMKPEDMIIEIVSEGHSGISENENDPVKVPENSEVYRKMEGKTSGDFILTGTDGNNYNYRFEIAG